MEPEFIAVFVALGLQFAVAVAALEHLSRELGRIRESIERGERRSTGDRRQGGGGGRDD